jgi:hypothetical protein
MVSGASLVSSSSCADPQKRSVDLTEHKALVGVMFGDEPGHGLRPPHLPSTRGLAGNRSLRRTRDTSNATDEQEFPKKIVAFRRAEPCRVQSGVKLMVKQKYIAQHMDINENLLLLASRES